MKDTIPIDSNAELSLDNVLTDIRFRASSGYKLKDYTFSEDLSSVVLEFEPCGEASESSENGP